MKKLLVILGSTSTGKTDLALSLAKEFNGELVSCDSRQLYRKLDIGTGKLPSQQVAVKKGDGLWEMDGVKVWMYDMVSPDKQYTAADYVKDASRATDKVLKRNKLPIIVGGAGLYLRALLEGLPNLAIPVDQRLRKKLEKLSRDELQKKLQEVCLRRWEQMNYSDRQNPRRLMRAIELSADFPIKIATSLVSLAPRNDILKIGLIAPRQILYQRINERVISRINQGMVEEVEELHKRGLSLKRMKQLGLEYGVLADYLEGKIKNREELVKVMQGKIHGFARRQITWFKKEQGVFWFDIGDKDFPGNVEKAVAKWYHQADDTKS